MVDTSRLESLVAFIDSEIAASGEAASSRAVPQSDIVAGSTKRAIRILPNFPAAGKPARKLPRAFAPATGEPPRTIPILKPPPGVPTIYTRSEGETNELCAAVAAEVAAGALELVGLDCEWRVSYVAGEMQPCVAVVQLCTPSAIYVFHLSAMSRCPANLASLIEDGRLLKAGSKLLNDCHKLRRDFALCGAGIVELGDLAAACLRHGERPWSLAELTETVLGSRLPKDGVRTSEWDASRLSEEQIEYAALDAYASRAVALALFAKLLPKEARPLLTNVPPELIIHVEADPMWTRRAEGRQHCQRRRDPNDGAPTAAAPPPAPAAAAAGQVEHQAAGEATV